MLNLGYQELALIAIVALVVVGPRRIPEVMRTVGNATTWLRRMTNDLMREIEHADQNSIAESSAATDLRAVRREIERKISDGPSDIQK